MHTTIPNMITKFKYETGQTLNENSDMNIPSGSFNKNLMCLFTILDSN